MRQITRYRYFATTYAEMHKFSLENPQEYWAARAKTLHWDKPFTKVLDSSNPPMYRWFPDGKMNICYNCLDRHVKEGRGDQWALIYDSPMINRVVHYTYDELLEEVQKMAGVLTYRHKVQKGDRVIIYMPLVPEAIVAMLACARVGAIHSVVFGGFAAGELANRIVDAKPKLIFTSNVGLEPGRKIPYLPIVEQACEIAENSGLANATKIRRIVLNRGQDVPCPLTSHRDYDFYDEMANSKPMSSVVSVASTHPLYVLYTSGTTGAPKGVVRDHGGYAVALNTALETIFDIHPGEVFWAASDIGWVVGHSFMTYGPLLRGSTSIMYEGKPVGTPDASAWWRVISQHSVKSLFVAPTGVRAIKREDPNGKLMRSFDLSSLKHMGLAGERCDPDTVHWLQKHMPKDLLINDHWWQTESGWPMISNYSNLETLPTKPGSATKPLPGWDIQVLDDEGKPQPSNVSGLMCVKEPTPPGFMLTLWNNDKAFVDKYFKQVPGYYLAGDEGYVDEDGYYYIMGRIDDVINTAGHRISCGRIEEIIAFHPAIAECAVIGVHDTLKGELPVALLVLKSDANIEEVDLEAEVIKKVREEMGSIAAFRRCLIVNRLPKTRSGKILRATLRKLASGQEYQMPSTIEAPEVLEELRAMFVEHGFIKK